MKILVLGASGRLGRNVVTSLLGQGNRVRAFIHSENLLVSHSELEFVHGDVHDRTVVEGAARGVDAVIATLGSASSPLKDVSSSAMRNLIPAMIPRACFINRFGLKLGTFARGGWFDELLA